MRWSESIDMYCERTDPGLWSEPLNALTNLAFLLAALFAYLSLRTDERGGLHHRRLDPGVGGQAPGEPGQDVGPRHVGERPQRRERDEPGEAADRVARTVVETGVAAGWSSLAILLALRDNGGGLLDQAIELVESFDRIATDREIDLAAILAQLGGDVREPEARIHLTLVTRGRVEHDEVVAEAVGLRESEGCRHVESKLPAMKEANERVWAGPSHFVGCHSIRGSRRNQRSWRTAN